MQTSGPEQGNFFLPSTTTVVLVAWLTPQSEKRICALPRPDLCLQSSDVEKKQPPGPLTSPRIFVGFSVSPVSWLGHHRSFAFPSLHVQGWCQLLGAKAALRSPTSFAWACQALHRGVGSHLGRMGRGVLGGPWVAEDPGYPIPGPEASWADMAEAKLAVGISLCSLSLVLLLPRVLREAAQVDSQWACREGLSACGPRDQFYLSFFQNPRLCVSIGCW